MKSTSGSTTSARAKPTRCFMPPEVPWDRRFRNRRDRPCRGSSGARLRRSSAATPRAFSGASTFSMTVSQGKSAKLWKTMATLGAHSRMGRPCQRTSPPEGWLEAGQHTQQGALATAGGTEQGEDLSGIDGEIGGRDHRNGVRVMLAVKLLDLRGLDDGFWHDGSQRGRPASSGGLSL